MENKQGLSTIVIQQTEIGIKLNYVTYRIRQHSESCMIIHRFILTNLQILILTLMSSLLSQPLFKNSEFSSNKHSLSNPTSPSSPPNISYLELSAEPARHCRVSRRDSSIHQRLFYSEKTEDYRIGCRNLSKRQILERAFFTGEKINSSAPDRQGCGVGARSQTWTTLSLSRPTPTDKTFTSVS